MDSVESLAATLEGLRQVREEKVLSTRRRWVRHPRPPRPMGLVAARLTVNPFESFMLVAIIVSGVAYALGARPPGSILTLLPAAAVVAWAGTLTVGGLSVAYGGLFRSSNLERSIALYQFGWGLVGTACLIYALAVLIVFTTTAVFAALTQLFFSFACFTRVYQVQRFFQLAQTVMKYGPEALDHDFVLPANGGPHDTSR